MAKSNAPQTSETKAPDQAPETLIEEGQSPVDESLLSPEGDADLSALLPSVQANEVADEVLDLVRVFVPKDFQLRLDQHHCKTFVRGEQDMERQHALHWFAVANGVTVL